MKTSGLICLRKCNGRIGAIGEFFLFVELRVLVNQTNGSFAVVVVVVVL